MVSNPVLIAVPRRKNYVRRGVNQSGKVSGRQRCRDSGACVRRYRRHRYPVQEWQAAKELKTRSPIRSWREAEVSKTMTSGRGDRKH